MPPALAVVGAINVDLVVTADALPRAGETVVGDGPARHGAGRVAVVDFDVHHGNGTQAVFEGDPSVLFISMHQDPRTCYPGTGFDWEIGHGPGKGSPSPGFSESRRGGAGH